MRLVASIVLIVAVASTVSAYDAYKLLLGEVTDSLTCDIANGGSAPNTNYTALVPIKVDSTPEDYTVAFNPCMPAFSECGAKGGAYLTLTAAAGGVCFAFDTESASAYENSTVTLTFKSITHTAIVSIECDPDATSNLTFANGNITTETSVTHLQFKSSAPCSPFVPTPAPVTGTPAPTEGSGDSSKLSTGAVVGIIAGSAVVVVSLGVAITKFRASTGSSNEGTYSRV